jgi:hypothetical protein
VIAGCLEGVLSYRTQIFWFVSEKLKYQIVRKYPEVSASMVRYDQGTIIGLVGLFLMNSLLFRESVPRLVDNTHFAFPVFFSIFMNRNPSQVAPWT